MLSCEPFVNSEVKKKKGRTHLCISPSPSKQQKQHIEVVLLASKTLQVANQHGLPSLLRDWETWSFGGFLRFSPHLQNIWGFSMRGSPNTRICSRLRRSRKVRAAGANKSVCCENAERPQYSEESCGVAARRNGSRESTRPYICVTQKTPGCFAVTVNERESHPDCPQQSAIPPFGIIATSSLIFGWPRGIIVLSF